MFVYTLNTGDLTPAPCVAHRQEWDQCPHLTGKEANICVFQHVDSTSKY